MTKRCYGTSLCRDNRNKNSNSVIRHIIIKSLSYTVIIDSAVLAIPILTAAALERGRAGMAGFKQFFRIAQ
jgi:hypothetical protein